MRLRQPEVEVIRGTYHGLGLIEFAGRTCYQSRDNAKTSKEEFVKSIMDMGHESILEHAHITMRVVCDRGVSHEWVRHRLFSYSQESTRYCNYNKNHIDFIIPSWISWPSMDIHMSTPIRDQLAELDIMPSANEFLWANQCLAAEIAYKDMIDCGWTPQQARSILPNSLKTEIVCTTNLREWLHFFRLRCSAKAHPDMYKVATMALDLAMHYAPVVFNEFKI